MRKACILLALLSFSIFSCKRNNNDNIKLPPGYVLNGVSDVTVERDSMAMLSIDVSLQQGRPQEPVTITVGGLPAGVTATVTPASGTPEFNATVTFRASLAATEGKYPITVNVQGDAGTKTYSLNLNVTSISECVSKITGTYDAIDMCDTNTGTAYTINVYPALNKANRIQLSGFFASSPGMSVYATIDCNKQTLTVPTQIMQIYQVSGSGVYNKDSMTINYTMMSSFDTVTCTTVLKR
jgi:hypothetical protein